MRLESGIAKKGVHGHWNFHIWRICVKPTTYQDHYGVRYKKVCAGKRAEEKFPQEV